MNHPHGNTSVYFARKSLWPYISFTSTNQQPTPANHDSNVLSVRSCFIQLHVEHFIRRLAWALKYNCLTLFEIFIFCPKTQFWFPEKNCQIVYGESSWKCCGFGLFSCWQLWFHEKNCQKKFGWITRENVGDLHFLVVLKFCQNPIFGQIFDFSNSVIFCAF